VDCLNYASRMTSEPEPRPENPMPVPATGYTPPAYPPNPYGGYAYAPPRPTNGKAIASLVVSIASFMVCPLFAIAGVILGNQARAEIRERGEEGDGLALAGIITGWIGVGYVVLLLLFMVSFFIFIPFSTSMD